MMQDLAPTSRQDGGKNVARLSDDDLFMYVFPFLSSFFAGYMYLRRYGRPSSREVEWGTPKKALSRPFSAGFE